MCYLIIVFLISFCSYSQTAIEKNVFGWSLFVDGKTFEIMGVTFGYNKDIANYNTYFKGFNFFVSIPLELKRRFKLYLFWIGFVY